jgi:hypothetical protein
VTILTATRGTGKAARHRQAGSGPARMTSAQGQDRRFTGGFAADPTLCCVVPDKKAASENRRLRLPALVSVREQRESSESVR